MRYKSIVATTEPDINGSMLALSALQEIAQDAPGKPLVYLSIGQTLGEQRLEKLPLVGHCTMARLRGNTLEVELEVNENLVDIAIEPQRMYAIPFGIVRRVTRAGGSAQIVTSIESIGFALKGSPEGLVGLTRLETQDLGKQ